jgi:hypothetical protein
MVRSRPQLLQVQLSGCLATFSSERLFLSGVIFFFFRNRSVQSWQVQAST